jgi:hypothetical protein
MSSLALVLAAAVGTSVAPVRSFWKLEDAPRPQPVQTRVTAELVRESDHLIVYRENGYRFSTLGETDEDAQVTQAASTFDRVIYPRLVELFGPCPDIDGNGKVILLLTRSTRDEITFLGFDQMSDAEALRSGLHSNVGEVLYLSFSLQGNRAIANTAALAASFAHLLQYARDPGEVAWADLMGNHAAAACGLVGPRSLWGDGGHLVASPSPADPWSASGWPLLLLEYLRQRLGEQALQSLAARPEPGLAGLEAALATAQPPQNFPAVAADFAMACWLDDAGVSAGRFSFTSLAPPRPPLAAHFPASRPSSGQVSCGAGGLVHLLVQGDGERPLPLALRGDPGVRWVGRAVHLRQRGPDEELPLSFDDSGLARLDPPLLPTGDGVIIALMARPPATPDFDNRRLALLWGLGWVPRAWSDPVAASFRPLVDKALGSNAVAALERIGTSLDRLGGIAPLANGAERLRTRYAWAPSAGESVAAIQAEIDQRHLAWRPFLFLRSAPPDIRQEWQNVLIDLPGGDQRRWPVVIAAHWDAARGSLAESYQRALGLDDNASGVVVALEAARLAARAQRRAPILIAFLAGGDHGAAGAAALLESLGGRASAWIELDAVGRPATLSPHLEVRLEGAGERDPVASAVTAALRRVGLRPVAIKEIGASHTGVSLAQARGIPALVVRTRDAEVAATDGDTPAAVERTEVSTELMALLAEALGQSVATLAGAPK